MNEVQSLNQVFYLIRGVRNNNSDTPRENEFSKIYENKNNYETGTYDDLIILLNKCRSNSRVKRSVHSD